MIDGVTFKPKPISVDEKTAEKNLSYLSDSISSDLFQKHHQMLKSGIYVNYFSQVNGSLSIYRHSVVKPEDNEKIISINPHQGGPLKYFNESSGKSCEIHTFEERNVMFSQVCQNICAWEIEDTTHPICAAISSITGLVVLKNDWGAGISNAGYFEALTDGNRQGGELVAPSYRIDDYVAITGFVPSLIECGRAGLSVEILDGAADTIARYQPKLILVDSPYTNVFEKINSISDGYRFYYSECGRRKFGAFFAIPKSGVQHG